MRSLMLLFFLLPLVLYGQSPANGELTVSYEQITTDWTQIHSQDGVLFFIQKTDCNRPEDGIFQEMAMIKLVNTTEFDLLLSWDLLLWFDGQLKTRLPITAENQRQVFLKGGEMLEGLCDKHSDYYTSLAVFCRFLNYEDKPELTQFQLSNINISRYEN